MKSNGWKRILYLAGAITVLGTAAAALQPFTYSVWAPTVTFALATENTLARLDNQLITLLTLAAAARASNDDAAARRLRLLIKAKEREISNIEKLKGKHK